MDRLMAFLRYRVSNFTAIAKTILLVFIILFLIVIVFYNSELITIAIPFTSMELFAPKFIFIILAQPFWFVVRFLLSIAILPPNKKETTKEKEELQSI